MKKAKIKIEKIFRNIAQTKNGPVNRFTLIYKNFGFNGLGDGKEYKEGNVVEVEYDENSKYQGEKYTYYNLIQKRNFKSDIIKREDMLEETIKEILQIVKRIEKKLNTKKDNNQKNKKGHFKNKKKINE